MSVLLLFIGCPISWTPAYADSVEQQVLQLLPPSDSQYGRRLSLISWEPTSDWRKRLLQAIPMFDRAFLVYQPTKDLSEDYQMIVCLNRELQALEIPSRPVLFSDPLERITYSAHYQVLFNDGKTEGGSSSIGFGLWGSPQIEDRCLKIDESIVQTRARRWEPFNHAADRQFSAVGIRAVVISIARHGSDEGLQNQTEMVPLLIEIR
jgi:hypothetical protein